MAALEEATRTGTLAVGHQRPPGSRPERRRPAPGRLASDLTASAPPSLYPGTTAAAVRRIRGEARARAGRTSVRHHTRRAPVCAPPPPRPSAGPAGRGPSLAARLCAGSHVLPALIRRFHEAKACNAPEVVVWGSGSPLREFLHVDDLADAVIFLMDQYSGLEHVNVGSGSEVTIKELAELVKEVVGFQGKLVWDSSKPDGTPRKLMDSSKIQGMGWKPKIAPKEVLVETYKCSFKDAVCPC